MKHSKVLQFVKLDFFTVISFFKMFLIFFVMAIGLTIAEPRIMVIILLGFISTLYAQPYFFSADEKYELDRLYATLPMTNKDIVCARYISGAVLSFIFYLFYLILGVAAALIKDLDLGSFLQILAMSYGLNFIFASIEFPLLYKFGFSKIQIIQMVPVFFAVVATILPKILFDVDVLTSFTISTWLSGVIILIGIAVYFVSYLLSSKIREGKFD